MKSECELSIVIVSFNTLDMTHECLHSILKNSKGCDWEIIVVDNNSQDGTVTAIRRDFPSVIIIGNNINKGFAAANNQAFSICRGRHILLLNSDTIILGDVLSASINFFKNSPLVGAMGCRVVNTDQTVQLTCSGFPTLRRLLFMTLGLDRIIWLSELDRYIMRRWERDNQRDVEVISGCFLMIRREALETVGTLDESFFFYGEETDWCKRARNIGWRLVFAPVGSIVHHGGGSVRKLNHKRDVMLTEATIRLHLKHGGIIRAVLAYVILMGFNLSRTAIYCLLMLGKHQNRKRAYHFFEVIAAWRDWWPVKRG